MALTIKNGVVGSGQPEFNPDIFIEAINLINGHMYGSKYHYMDKN